MPSSIISWTGSMLPTASWLVSLECSPRISSSFGKPMFPAPKGRCRPAGTLVAVGLLPIQSDPQKERPMAQEFHSGQIVPESGIYRITHDPVHADIGLAPL